MKISDNKEYLFIVIINVSYWVVFFIIMKYNIARKLKVNNAIIVSTGLMFNKIISKHIFFCNKKLTTFKLKIKL